MCCSFINISYFGLKFLRYTLNILYTFEICKKKKILKPEHETTSLSHVLACKISCNERKKILPSITSQSYLKEEKHLNKISVLVFEKSCSPTSKIVLRKNAFKTKVDS